MVVGLCWIFEQNVLTILMVTVAARGQAARSESVV